MNRADKLNILRNKPKPGYDFSFLVTNYHLQTLHKGGNRGLYCGIRFRFLKRIKRHEIVK